MEEEKIEIVVPEEYHLERVDRFITRSLEIDLSRSFIQKLIRDGRITVNGYTIKQNYRVKNDDVILIVIPEPEDFRFEPENIAVEILHEDASIAVINKAAGMVVHPGPGNWNGTLANALLFHLKDLSAIGGVLRPGIVHRLDRDTSGVMVVAKSDAAHRFLAGEFAGRRVLKKYIAVVQEKPKCGQGTIDQPIGRHPRYRQKMAIVPGGREAVTEYFLQKIWNTNKGVFSLLDVRPHTGRTHQIRVHLSSTGTPIVGDPIYSRKWAKYNIPYLLLAAVSLEFTHPDSRNRVTFNIPIPEHIADFIRKLDAAAL